MPIETEPICQECLNATSSRGGKKAPKRTPPISLRNALVFETKSKRLFATGYGLVVVLVVVLVVGITMIAS